MSDKEIAYTFLMLGKMIAFTEVARAGRKHALFKLAAFNMVGEIQKEIERRRKP